MKNNLLLRGYLPIIISAIIYGCMPLMANLIYDDGVNAMTLVLLRNLLSLPVLFLMATVTRQSFRTDLKCGLRSAAIGMIGCGLTPLLLFASYGFVSGGTAMVFHYVYPSVVLLLEILVLRMKTRWISVVAIIVCVLGIALFYDPAEGLDLAGSVLALSSGVTYAIYIVLLGKFGTGGLAPYVFSFFAVCCTFAC